MIADVRAFMRDVLQDHGYVFGALLLLMFVTMALMMAPVAGPLWCLGALFHRLAGRDPR